MEIRCVETGRVRVKSGERGISRYLIDRWSSTTLPVQCFLVEHERGWCMFDTGQTPRASMRGHFPRWQPFFRLARFELGPDEAIGARLRQMGIPSGGVRWVVLSHLHTDHVGGVGDLRGAEVVVASREWERAQGLAGKIRGYLPDLWPHTVRPTLIELDGPPVGPFPATYDLAGDGRLLVVPAPGHTAAHIALLIRDVDGDVLLGGDMAESWADLRLRDPLVAEWCEAIGVSFVAAHDEAAGSILAARSRRSSCGKSMRR